MPPSFLPVLAQEAVAPRAPSGPGGDFKVFLYMGVIFAVFYFLMIRPQQKQEKARREALDKVKKHDRVVLGGGLLGTVVDVREDEVSVRVSESPDVRVRVRRTGIVEILP